MIVLFIYYIFCCETQYKRLSVIGSHFGIKCLINRDFIFSIFSQFQTLNFIPEVGETSAWVLSCFHSGNFFLFLLYLILLALPFSLSKRLVFYLCFILSLFQLPLFFSHSTICLSSDQRVQLAKSHFSALAFIAFLIVLDSYKFHTAV